MFRRHPVLAPLTLLYLAGVAWITLGPQPLDNHQQEWVYRLLVFARRVTEYRWPRLSEQLTYAHVEFAANIAMFIPVGVFFVLLLGRRLWWAAILLCFGMTLAIEAAQRYIPGRVSDVRDLESNGLGAIIGVLLALLLTIPSALRERDRRRIDELEGELARYRAQRG
ncbi:VanZ family protein [Gryllotalpicola ginsengisoli]|uniref:VanZ family protein n=1 Tax=Gryllotalpicola ginsengisoli TaxID=444608 RepID=UPI0003B3C243|nr:VanZ family protein [Gryllotalpicola ginsengisoli]